MNMAISGRHFAKAENMWNPDSRARRPAITQGFIMPGFAGKFWIWPEEYALLAKYVDLTQGGYLEIGSMCGIIAMSLAEKYPHRDFTCVDAFTSGHGTIAGERDTFLQNLRQHELHNVTLVEGDSLAVVPTLSREVDIAFVDGNHAYEYVLGDAMNAWRLVAPGGFLAFHDYGCVEDTTRAVHEFLEQTGAQLVEVASSLAIVRKADSGAQALPPTIDLAPVVEGLQRELAESHAQVENLTGKLATLRDDSARVSDEKTQLESVLRAVEHSAGWRMLNLCRGAREKALPPCSYRRKVYDFLLRPLKNKGPDRV